jgi:hypothetical protein
MSRLNRLVVTILGVIALTTASAGTALATPITFLPGAGSFTGTSGLSFLLTVGGTQLTCKKDKLTGKFDSKTLALTKIDFEECESNGLKCNTTGDATGVILTEELDAKPVWITKTGELAGLLFKPAIAGGNFATFECTALVHITVKGELLCNVSPANTDTKTYIIKCEESAPGSGKSKYTEYSEELPVIKKVVAPLLCEINKSGKFEECAVVDEETVTPEVLIEIMT